jgi:hypothetical protein
MPGQNAHKKPGFYNMNMALSQNDKPVRACNMDDNKAGNPCGNYTWVMRLHKHGCNCDTTWNDYHDYHAPCHVGQTNQMKAITQKSLLHLF